jgi:hypothetical protein
MRQKGDGFSHGTTLHYPLDQGLWEFRRAPGDEPDPALRGADAAAALDLALPQLAVRSGVLEPVQGPQADGVWKVNAMRLYAGGRRACAGIDCVLRLKGLGRDVSRGRGAEVG